MADRRLLADFDEDGRCWQIAPGSFEVAVGASAADLKLHGAADVAAARIAP